MKLLIHKHKHGDDFLYLRDEHLRDMEGFYDESSDDESIAAINEWIPDPMGFDNFVYIHQIPIRVYGINLYECDLDTYDLDNESFIDEANKQGYVWTLEGFERAFNKEEFPVDNFIIRFI